MSPKDLLSASYVPIKINDVFDDFFSLFFDSLTPSCSNYAVPANIIFQTKPVSNYYINKEDGTSVLQIAATGFSKNEISLEVEGDVLIVNAESKKEKIDETKITYVHKRIFQEDFEIRYKLSPKMDTSKITSKLEDGILTISIAMKEEDKPIKKQILID